MHVYEYVSTPQTIRTCVRFLFACLFVWMDVYDACVSSLRAKLAQPEMLWKAMLGFTTAELCVIQVRVRVCVRVCVRERVSVCVCAQIWKRVCVRIWKMTDLEKEDLVSAVPTLPLPFFPFSTPTRIHRIDICRPSQTHPHTQIPLNPFRLYTHPGNITVPKNNNPLHEQEQEIKEDGYTYIYIYIIELTKN